jgi:hypothetical protein
MSDAVRWLLDGLEAQLDRGELTFPLLLLLLCWLGPGLWVWWWRSFVLRKVQRLHEEIVQQKDAEIARMVKLYGGRQLTPPGPATAPAVEKLSSLKTTQE